MTTGQGMEARVFITEARRVSWMLASISGSREGDRKGNCQRDSYREAGMSVNALRIGGTIAPGNEIVDQCTSSSPPVFSIPA